MTGSVFGVDMEEGVRRAGNSPALYLRFLKRFPTDPTFAALRAAVGDGRIRDAFLCAHTLKGLTAQLGITALYSQINELCELLRAGDDQALPEARQLLEAMVPLYESVARGIAALP